jgi:hypothetical protein
MQGDAGPGWGSLLVLGAKMELSMWQWRVFHEDKFMLVLRKHIFIKNFDQSMDLTHWESHSEHDLHSIHGRSFQISINVYRRVSCRFGWVNVVQKG